MAYYDNITDFVFYETKPDKADLIMIPGSRYGQLAIRAAGLYREGYAKKILVSGKYSVLKNEFYGPEAPEEYRGKIFKTECEFLSCVLEDHGVRREDILPEDQASFTFENAIYSRKLLEKKGMDPDPEKVILVCQTFHARRCLMYYQLVFPETEFLVCPADTQQITRDNWFLDEHKIEVVLGEVERCASQFQNILKGTDTVWEKEKKE